MLISSHPLLLPVVELPDRGPNRKHETNRRPRRVFGRFFIDSTRR